MYSPSAFKVPGAYPGAGHVVVMSAKKKKIPAFREYSFWQRKSIRHIKSENVGYTIRKTITDEHDGKGNGFAFCFRLGSAYFFLLAPPFSHQLSSPTYLPSEKSKSKSSIINTKHPKTKFWFRIPEEIASGKTELRVKWMGISYIWKQRFSTQCHI